MDTFSANQANRQKWVKTPRKIHCDKHCSWVLRLIEENIGHIEGTGYTFPSNLLAYFRKVVP